MILTKVVSHHDSTPLYINLDHVVSVNLHEGEDYHVEMSDGSSMHVVLTDKIILDLIAAADSIYVA